MTFAKPLSPRMTELVRFVAHYTDVHRYPPSTGDMAEFLGITRTVALRYAREAAARGALAFDERTARSWRVVDLSAIGPVKATKKIGKAGRRS